MSFGQRTFDILNSDGNLSYVVKGPSSVKICCKTFCRCCVKCIKNDVEFGIFKVRLGTERLSPLPWRYCPSALYSVKSRDYRIEDWKGSYGPFCSSSFPSTFLPFRLLTLHFPTGYLTFVAWQPGGLNNHFTSNHFLSSTLRVKGY